MTRNCPHTDLSFNSAVGSSMASSSQCKCTDDEPFILVPTGEELLAQAFMKTAIQLGLLTVFLVFLNLYLGVAIEYIVVPIAVGLGGSAIVSLVATLRAEDAEKKAHRLREEAKEKEKKAKREKMELACGLKDKQSTLEQEKTLLNDKADRLDKKEKNLEHREKTLEDEIERRTKAEVEKRLFQRGRRTRSMLDRMTIQTTASRSYQDIKYLWQQWNLSSVSNSLDSSLVSPGA